MEERYLRPSELVVRCIPSIAEESCFAIKGGTAINLFELDLPRLSVDIDFEHALDLSRRARTPPSSSSGRGAASVLL